MTFPVIKRNKRKISVFQGIMMVIVVFLLIYVIIYKTYFREDIASSVLSAIVFVLLIIAVFIVNFLMQKFRFGGELTITDKEIILSTTNRTSTYPINELSNLKFICNASKSDVVGNYAQQLKGLKAWLFGKYEGKGNYVEFNFKGDLHSFEIYIKGKEDAEAFIQKGMELVH